MNRVLLLRLTIEGLYPEGAAMKLKREQIPLYFLQKIDKNRIELCIERKYRKKVFTKLNDSCYNIIGVEYYGLYRLLSLMKKRIGLAVGGGMFLLFASLASLPVLRINVVGEGAYYERQVREILQRNQVTVGALYDGEKAPLMTAQILSLPDVIFCSLKKSGNVLWVEVQTKSPPAPVCKRGGKIFAEHAGRVSGITLLRGMPKVNVGDQVEKGALLAEAESENSVLMASVSLLVTVSERVQASTEAEAVQALKFRHGMGEDVKEVARKVEKQSTGEFLVSLQIEVTYRENM